MGATSHTESRTHAIIWCPCLVVVPVAQCLDEKRPIAIRFGIPARNRLWHTGRMASAVCPWPLRIINRYRIEYPGCGIRSMADLQASAHNPSAPRSDSAYRCCNQRFCMVSSLHRHASTINPVPTWNRVIVVYPDTRYRPSTLAKTCPESQQYSHDR